MIIQHNISALNSHRNMGINNSKTSKNLEKLSSGYKINRAGDDAAGLAISEKMRGQIRGLAMAEQNANNGISLIQTAEGGLNETHDILQRMRELAVQSVNGTYQDEDRTQIELEYQKLKSEIDRIASYTNYNGIKLLDGTVGGVQLSNATPAEQLTGTQAEILTKLGVNGGAQPTIAFTPGTALITKDNKDFNQNVASNGTISGFGAALGASVTVTAAAGESFYDIDAFADITLTKNSSGTWDAVISSSDARLTNATATFSTGTNSILTITAQDGSKYEMDLGAYTADDVGGTAAQLGGYAEGSSITLSAHLKTTTNTNNSSEFTAVVDAETVLYDTDAAAGGTQVGGLAFSWNADTKMWDVTGKFELESVTGTKSYKETVELKGSFDPTATGTFSLIGVLKNNSTVTFDIDLSEFAIPPQADLSYATFRLDGAMGALNLSGLEAYKNAKPAEVTPDLVRADRMLDAMGISNSSKFNINQTLANGTTEEKTLFEALNNKDAYILTRLSTADADRGVYAADSRYETLLQVGDKTYLGTLNGTTWEFKDDNGTTVASLSNSDFATETGSIRFNTGDVTNDKYYKQFLVQKEGAQIGSENVAQLKFQIGANGAEDQRVGMYVLNMSSNNLGDHEKGQFVSESTIVTGDEADVSVRVLDKAINYVSAQRAQLGALQNRLEHTLNNLGVTKENLTAAESSIRDVDMAKEMMDFTKNNILVQASQAMLAQANQLPQGVLSLLR